MRKHKPRAQIKEMDTPFVSQFNAKKEAQSIWRKGLIRRLTVMGLGFALVFVLMISAFFNMQNQKSDLENDVVQLEEDYQTLTTEESNLKEEIELLNDEDYILDLARSKYFLSKKGELLFQVED